jgi:hypothetical protein
MSTVASRGTSTVTRHVGIEMQSFVPMIIVGGTLTGVIGILGTIGEDTRVSIDRTGGADGREAVVRGR